MERTLERFFVCLEACVLSCCSAISEIKPMGERSQHVPPTTIFFCSVRDIVVGREKKAAEWALLS